MPRRRELVAAVARFRHCHAVFAAAVGISVKGVEVARRAHATKAGVLHATFHLPPMRPSLPTSDSRTGPRHSPAATCGAAGAEVEGCPIAAATNASSISPAAAKRCLQFIVMRHPTQ